MRELPTDTRMKGFNYRQIARDGDFAVYEQRLNGKLASLELIHVQKRRATTIQGKEIPAHEAFPPSEAWGSKGWTFQPHEREQALERMREHRVRP